MQDSHNTSPSQPEEQFNDDEGNPKFGRLLIVLVVAVVLIAVLTFISEAWYS